jgi:hypothetical protein
MRTINHWIGGQTSDTEPERTGAVYDPATGQQTARVAYASGDDVDAAVRAAQAAFPAWRDTSVVKRARVMFKFLELLQRNRDELARIIASEHGKVVPDAAGEIQRGMEVVEVATGIPHLLKGDFSENVSTEVDCYSIRQPIGVAAGITPFNFPIMVPMWMHPIAIACGNAFVLKPSERDPSVSLRVAELYAEAGLPDGDLQRRPRRQGGGRRHPRPPRHRVGVVRRLDPDRPLHLRARHLLRQARPGPRRGQEPRRSSCPTPTWTRPPTRWCRPPTAPPASAAWPSPPPWPSARPATP